MHAQYFALINLNWNIQIWKNQLPAQILYPITIPDSEHHVTEIILLKVDLEAEDYDYSFGAPSMSNYSTLGTLDTRYWPSDQSEACILPSAQSEAYILTSDQSEACL